MRGAYTWVGVLLLATAAGAQPVTVSIAAVASQLSAEQAAQLDGLISGGLAADEFSERLALAEEGRAEVMVRPELGPTPEGKIRLLWVLVARDRPELTDRIGFEFNKPRFGPAGIAQMLRVVADRAAVLRERARVPREGAQPKVVQRVQPPAPEEAPGERGRLRWGIGLGAGTFLPGLLLSLGGELRAGWQFNRMIGAFASFGGNAGFALGGSFTPGSANLSVGADAYWYVGLGGELVVDDHFFVSLGPQLISGGWAFIGQDVDASGGVRQRAFAAGGYLPGVNLKLGVGFGSRNEKTGRRNQFSLTLDTTLALAPNTVTGSQVVDVGGVMQSVDVRGVALGVAPVITIGFDGR